MPQGSTAAAALLRRGTVPNEKSRVCVIYHPGRGLEAKTKKKIRDEGRRGDKYWRVGEKRGEDEFSDFRLH